MSNIKITTEAERKAAAERHSRIYNAQHTAREVSKIPEKAHIAILVNESMRYDDGYGDSRSGPSYSTHEYLSYLYFDTEEALEDWIIKNHTSKTYRVVHMKPVTVTLKTQINVEMG